MNSDMILHNGHILTMSPEPGAHEAVGFRGDRIAGVGTLDEVRRLLPRDALTLDLNGRFVLPGFIDAHSHPVLNAQTGITAGLEGVASVEQLQKRIQDEVARQVPGEYVQGMNLDHTRFPSSRLPTRWDLDEVSPHNPVLVAIVGGHFTLANSTALRRAGVSEKTADPPGGHFVRDSQGRLTGLCLDAATSAVSPGISVGSHAPNLHPPADLGELATELTALFDRYLRYGITTIVDAQTTRRELGIYQNARRRGGLPIRTVCFAISSQLDEVIELGLEAPFGDEWLRLAGIKFYCDGTMNGETVSFKSPELKAKQSSEYGFPPTLFWDRQGLTQAVASAHTHHLPVAIHCHGDIAIDMALDAVETAIRRNGSESVRHRFEHVSFPTPEAIGRMADLGVVAVVQPIMIRNYGDQLIKRFGPLGAAAQPYESLRSAGVTVAFSGDNISPLDPLSVIRAGAQRVSVSGQAVGAEEALSLENALRAYTVEAATAIGMQDDLGTIDRGKYADVVVLDENPMKLGANQSEATEVAMTIVGGKIQWCAQEWKPDLVRGFDDVC